VAALTTGVPAAGTAGANHPSQGISAVALTRAVEYSLVDTMTFANPAGTQILGSGIIVSGTGLVLTDYHVVRDAVYVGLTIGGQGGVYPASVVVANPDDDVALLQINADPPLTPARLDLGSAVRVGQPVVAMGNAQGRGVAPSAVTGRLVALHRSISYTVGSNVVDLGGVMEVAAPIFGGDSGGALVDAAGSVVGMIAAGAGDVPCTAQDVCPLSTAFVIPIEQALAEIGYTGLP
jgi:S1-C subfamily serine protease